MIPTHVLVHGAFCTAANSGSSHIGFQLRPGGLADLLT